MGKNSDCQHRLNRVKGLGFKEVLDFPYNAPIAEGDIYVIDRDGLDERELNTLFDDAQIKIPDSAPLILYTGGTVLPKDQKTIFDNIGISAMSQNLFSFVGNIIDAVQFVSR